MYGRKDLVKITILTNLSVILRTIKKCLGTPLTTSINETPNKRIVFQNHTIVYGTTSTEQTGQENRPWIRPCSQG